MDYDEFVKVVTRHPRVFAPVNHIWNVLRQYAVGLSAHVSAQVYVHVSAQVSVHVESSCDP
jgi:hypothetical protein